MSFAGFLFFVAGVCVTFMLFSISPFHCNSFSSEISLKNNQIAQIWKFSKVKIQINAKEQ